ncbi:MAG: hypothetical protein QXU11_06540 [Thermoproteota archaeon]
MREILESTVSSRLSVIAPDLASIDDNVRVTVRLTDVYGVPISGETVGFLAQMFFLNGSDRVTIDYYVTNSSGMVSVDFPVAPGVAAVNFEGFFSGSPDHIGSSDLRTVFILPKIYDVYVEVPDFQYEVPVNSTTENDYNPS